MCASGRPITFLLFSLFSSAISSPVSMHTPAPPFPSQISPPSPSPTILPSLLSPSLSSPPPVPPLVSNSGGSAEKVSCPLTISPSTMVVKFGDPASANCSVPDKGFSLLGWKVSSAPPNITMSRFLVWSEDSMTNWTIKPTCFALSEMGGPCHYKLTLIVYKPPDNVSISFVNHTGPMLEGRQYTLQCTVQDVAPVENLTVAFYRGQTALGRLKSDNNTEEKTPMTVIFTLNITLTKEDDGAQYWCEAKLQLGPEGPRQPPVVMSEKITATVLFGPQFICPPKLQVREGESFSCEVRGNPQPFVTWFRDGQVVALPAHSSTQHAGKYIALAEGHLGQRNFTVEVEVLINGGSGSSCNRPFLLAVLLIQMIIWL